MKSEPSKQYRMPLGPMFDLHAKPQWAYPEIEVLGFQYLTSHGAIEAPIPDCFTPAKEPLVAVLLSQNNGLEFMAGGGYHLAAFQVAVTFDGEKDHIEGDFMLVMLGNQTWPILGGREDLGVPKLFADIPAIRKMKDGTIKCQASLWGHLLFSLEAPPMKSQLAPVRAVAQRRINSRPWLGYKYIPSLDGPPDAEYPTVSKNDKSIEKLWLGKTAALEFGTAGSDEIAYGRQLLDALTTLKVSKPVQSLYSKGPRCCAMTYLEDYIS